MTELGRVVGRGCAARSSLGAVLGEIPAASAGMTTLGTRVWRERGAGMTELGARGYDGAGGAGMAELGRGALRCP